MNHWRVRLCSKTETVFTWEHLELRKLLYYVLKFANVSNQTLQLDMSILSQFWVATYNKWVRFKSYIFSVFLQTEAWGFSRSWLDDSIFSKSENKEQISLIVIRLFKGF